MPDDSSMRTVLVALGSGLAVALAKAAVAVVTGSLPSLIWCHSASQRAR